jgi:hypothetical protein
MKLQHLPENQIGSRTHVSLFSQFLIAFCTFLVLGEAASTEATTQGFMEGHLKIVWMRAVEPSDELPRPEVAPETYAEYPLIVLSQGQKKEVARERWNLQLLGTSSSKRGAESKHAPASLLDMSGLKTMPPSWQLILRD